MENSNIEYSVAQEYNAQGKTLFVADKFEDALVYFQKAETEDPMLRDTYLNLGECLIMLDRFSDAKEAYEKLLLIDKNDGEAYFHLGNVAYLMNEEDKGREMYARAVNNGFDNEQMYLNTGCMQYDAGRYDDAIISFNKALARNKFLPIAHMNKAKSLYQLGQKDEAIFALDQMIQYLPEIFEGHHYKTLFQMECGKYDDAEETLKKAISIFPDDQAFKFDKLILLESRKMVAEALQYFEENFPEPCASLYLLEKAKLLAATEDRMDSALALLGKLAHDDDKDIVSQANFITMIVSVGGQSYDKALEACDNLINAQAKDMNYYTALYYKGIILSRMNDSFNAKKAFDRAVALLRMASSLEPGVMDYYMLRGLALKELGETEKAYEIVNYMTTVAPNMPEATLLRYILNKSADKNEEAKRDIDAIRNSGGVVSELVGLLGL